MKTLLSILLFFTSSNLFAALIDNGSGLIYDSDQDITWLSDANFAMTSGYDIDGMMTHSEAKTWVGNLIYAGFSDWRLPSAGESPTSGYYKFDSELGFLFYSIAGSSAQSSMENIEFFSNVANAGYWMNEKNSSNQSQAWLLHLENGLQASRWVKSNRYAWAVTDGNVALGLNAVPVPAAAFLFSSALLALIFVRR